MGPARPCCAPSSRGACRRCCAEAEKKTRACGRRPPILHRYAELVMPLLLSAKERALYQAIASRSARRFIDKIPSPFAPTDGVGEGDAEGDAGETGGQDAKEDAPAGGRIRIEDPVVVNTMLLRWWCEYASAKSTRQMIRKELQVRGLGPSARTGKEGRMRRHRTPRFRGSPRTPHLHPCTLMPRSTSSAASSPPSP